MLKWSKKCGRKKEEHPHGEIMEIMSCTGQQRAHSQFIKTGREHRYQLESFSFGLKLWSEEIHYLHPHWGIKWLTINTFAIGRINLISAKSSRGMQKLPFVLMLTHVLLANWKQSETADPQHIDPRVTHGSGSIMAWRWSRGAGTMVKVEGKMNGVIYRLIMEEHVWGCKRHPQRDEVFASSCMMTLNSQSRNGLLWTELYL